MENKIYVYNWGDDDNLVQFFKVIKETEKSITLRELKKEKVEKLEAAPGYVAYTVQPLEVFTKSPHGSKKGQEFRKKVTENGELKMQFGIATIWDGKPVKVQIRHR